MRNKTTTRGAQGTAAKRGVAGDSFVSGRACCSYLALVNVACLVAALFFYVSSREQLQKASDWLHRAQLLADRASERASSLPPPVQALAAAPLTATSPSSSLPPPPSTGSVVCDDAVWCAVPMPEKSHYNFDGPPNDPVRWRIAQAQAARGEQVLLQRVAKVFPSPWNSFLDGDKSFRGLHNLVDIFVDSTKDLGALLPGKVRLWPAWKYRH